MLKIAIWLIFIISYWLPRPLSIIQQRFFIWYSKQRYCLLRSPHLRWGLNGCSVTLSSLSQQEESQLYTFDRYFVKEYTDDSICVASKRITPKLLAEALRTLPEEKRNAVLLYYFEGMTDNDIAKLLNISRSTVQYRRTSSFELLKRYLEERAYDGEEI